MQETPTAAASVSAVLGVGLSVLQVAVIVTDKDMEELERGHWVNASTMGFQPPSQVLVNDGYNGLVCSYPKDPLNDGCFSGMTPNY